MHVQGNGNLQVAGDIMVYGAAVQSHGLRPGNSAEIDCPACHASISPLASACRHCHTNVLEFRSTVERERIRQLTLRVACVGLLGAAAGFLTWFHGADMLPAWLTTASAYLGAGGAAITTLSVVAAP